MRPWIGDVCAVVGARALMNIKVTRWVLALFVTVLGANSSLAQGPSGAPPEVKTLRGAVLKGKLASVSDGDTIVVAVAGGQTARIRLEGIDCPEPRQPYSRSATTFTRTLLGREALLIKVLDVDRYGRLVGRISVGDKDASLELVKAGLAWHYTDYSADRLLDAAEKEARGQRRGLWADPNPVPPWVARRSARSDASRARLVAALGPFHGNARSGVYHADRCKNARCQNCTLTFATQKEAEDAGLRPAGDCLR